MSYPEQVYRGDSGEVSAVFRPVNTPPGTGEAGEDAIHYLATTETTRGEFGLYRVEMKAKAGGSERFPPTLTALPQPLCPIGP